MENDTPITEAQKALDIVTKNPGSADIWSLGKIAMYLALGSTELELGEIYGLVSEDLFDFISNCLAEKPSQRMPAKTLLHHAFLDNIE